MKNSIEHNNILLISLIVISLAACKHKTSNSEQIVDIDRNIYKTVKICNQIWMAENLKVTRYNDGEAIPLVSDPLDWYNLTTPAYCWYNNDSANFSDKHGAYYNYYAINTGKLCPKGYHIPTNKEFQELIYALDQDANFERYNASNSAGGKLNESGYVRWLDDNTKASNETGFNALPAGCRSYAGNFSSIGDFSSFGGSPNETVMSIRSTSENIFLRNRIAKYVGVSVRCVRNQ